MATGGSKLTVSDPVSVGHPRSDQLQATVTDSGETHVKGVRASEASPRTAIQRADEWVRSGGGPAAPEWEATLERRARVASYSLEC